MNIELRKRIVTINIWPITLKLVYYPTKTKSNWKLSAVVLSLGAKSTLEPKDISDYIAGYF